MAGILTQKANEVVTAYTESSRHAFIAKKDGPRFRYSPERHMHVSTNGDASEAGTTAITTAISKAAELRYQNLAVRVFAIAVVYSMAIERIMTVEKVQKRQAETLFTQMNKAGLIRKNLFEQWEPNT